MKPSQAQTNFHSRLLALLGYSTKYTPSFGTRVFPSSFPFQFGVSRSHIAAMEQIEDRPVARFGKPDFVGGLLDGLAIADGGAGFIQYYREITLLRLQRLRPRQVAASMARHVVIRRNGGRNLH